jgi:hypothetical protein
MSSIALAGPWRRCETCSCSGVTRRDGATRVIRTAPSLRSCSTFLNNLPPEDRQQLYKKMDHSHMDHGHMDHGGMDHGMPGMDHGHKCNMNVRCTVYALAMELQDTERHG